LHGSDLEVRLGPSLVVQFPVVLNGLVFCSLFQFQLKLGVRFLVLPDLRCSIV
ncbi:hypothetical protein Dimus_037553, partial [Dionaea muscipula]